MRTSASWLQPADWCEKFQDLAQFSELGPARSWWPTMAEPSVLDEARRNGARVPVTALVDQFYADVQAMGGNRWDTSSLIRRLK